jgi:hypothetical protein
LSRGHPAYRSTREGVPSFVTGIVVVDLERVDADLGFEEGGRRCAVGERDKVVAGTAIAHGGDGDGAVKDGRDGRDPVFKLHCQPFKERYFTDHGEVRRLPEMVILRNLRRSPEITRRDSRLAIQPPPTYTVLSAANSPLFFYHSLPQ